MGKASRRNGQSTSDTPTKCELEVSKFKPAVLLLFTTKELEAELERRRGQDSKDNKNSEGPAAARSKV